MSATATKKSLPPASDQPASHYGALLDGDLLRVVCADDSELVLEVVRDLFEKLGAEVHTLSSAIGLSGALRRHRPELVVLDLNMPAIRGDEAVDIVRRVRPTAKVVIFSDDERAAYYAKERGVAWVPKGEPDKLVSAAMRLVAGRRRGGK